MGPYIPNKTPTASDLHYSPAPNPHDEQEYIDIDAISAQNEYIEEAQIAITKNENVLDDDNKDNDEQQRLLDDYKRQNIHHRALEQLNDEIDRIDENIEGQGTASWLAEC